MKLLAPTADFITSTLSGALATGVTTATIDSGLDIPATNGVLHINYDSAIAVGTDEGPETVTYATYTTATGALAGLSRGAAGTTDVDHANSSTVSAGISIEHLSSINNLNLDTTAGEPGGAWKTWAPVWVNLAGGSLNFAKYTQIGKTIHYKIEYTLAGAGVSGDVTFTLPVTSTSVTTAFPIGKVVILDSGTNLFDGLVTSASTTTGSVRVLLVNATYSVPATLSNTVPMTWANNDAISISGTYEAA